jgi:phage shock protein A
MGLFSRIFRWGKSEGHAVLDKLEDPVKMTEQGIVELKKDLHESLKSLAEVKSLAIRAKKDSEGKKESAADYEKKAMLLIEKAQKGQLDATEADRLATDALQKRDQLTNQALTVVQNQGQHEQMVQKLEANVKSLRSQVSSWETELSTLKARAKVAKATKKMNQQMAQIDSSGTIAMLEKMKDRVNEEESLAESYGQIAGNMTSVDDEINKALESGDTKTTSPSLESLKSKMGVK